MSEVKYREFWIDEMTEWFHKSFPEHLTKEPHQHKITHVIEYDALAAKDAEIKALLFRLDWATTTTELVDAHAEIEQLKKRISWLESGSIHTCHAECEKPLCVANREVERLKEVNVVSSKYWIEKESALLSKINDWESKIQQLENEELKEKVKLYAKLAGATDEFIKDELNDDMDA